MPLTGWLSVCAGSWANGCVGLLFRRLVKSVGIIG